MKIRNGFVSNSSSSSFCVYGVELTEKEYKALIKTQLASLVEASGETDEDEDCDDDYSYEIEELVSECEYVKENKLDVVNTGCDGDIELCMGFDLDGTELEGEALIAELTRVNNVLKTKFKRKGKIFSGTTYN